MSREQIIVPELFSCYTNGMPTISNKQRTSIVYTAVHTLTGERYIGFTSVSLNRRRSDHLKGAVNGWGVGKFSAAIRRDGVGAFEWSVLATFDNADDALAEEQRLIKTERPELNATAGGGMYKPLVHSAKTIRLLSRLAKKNIKKFQKHTHLGPKATARPVVCLDTGRTFDSAGEAAREIGVQRSMVIEVCNRNPRRRTAKGFVFRYLDEPHGGKDEADKIHRTPYRNGKNPYPGVHPHISDHAGTIRWRARLSCGGRKNVINMSLGIFDTPEEARDARNRAKEAVKNGTLIP